MPTISLPLSVLERFHPVWLAAHDEDRSSACLTGLAINPDAINPDGSPSIAIASTDGKVLVEEVWVAPIGNGSAPLETGLILSGDSILLLRDWCKSVRKTLGKGRSDAEIIMLIENRQVTASLKNCAIGDLKMATIDATYPKYKPVLERPVEISSPGRFGINGVYIGAVAKAWSASNKKGEMIIEWTGKGYVLRPLARIPHGCVSQRALVMPITLPS